MTSEEIGMFTNSLQLRRFLLLVLFLGGIHSSAYAYIDPGTAGFLYQLLYLIIGALAAYFLGLKNLLKRIFSRNKAKTKEPQNAPKS